jgi:hypothetical protein
MVAETAHRRLTHKEDWFARLVAQGRSKKDAYQEAYNSDSKNAKIGGYKVAKRPAVAARIRELAKPDEKRPFLTRARKRELLLQFAENVRASILERQRAIVIDNRMTGDDRQIVSVEGEITLVSVMAALNGSSPLPAEDEVIDVQSFQLPAGQKTEAEAPAAEVRAVSAETAEGVPAGETATPAGSAREQKRTPGPFEEDFDAFPVPEENPPQKRRTRVYPA